MRLLDRLAAWHVRTGVRMLGRRISETTGFVYRVRTFTTRPHRLRGALAPKSALLSVSVGPTDETACPLLTITLTREMFDALIDGAIEVRTLQDRQYVKAEDPR